MPEQSVRVRGDHLGSVWGGQGHHHCSQALSHEVLKPFLAACEIKSPKLVSTALASIQKLLANDVIDASGLVAVTGALEQVPYPTRQHAFQRRMRPDRLAECSACQGCAALPLCCVVLCLIKHRQLCHSLPPLQRHRVVL
jgi:hypothetical protein